NGCERDGSAGDTHQGRSPALGPDALHMAVDAYRVPRVKHGRLLPCPTPSRFTCNRKYVRQILDAPEPVGVLGPPGRFTCNTWNPSKMRAPFHVEHPTGTPGPGSFTWNTRRLAGLDLRFHVNPRR